MSGARLLIRQKLQSANPLLFVAAANGGGTSMTLPAHAAGELLVMQSTRHIDGLAPDAPAGWSSTAADGTIMARAGTSVGMRLAWKIAASAAEVSGTWPNSQNFVCCVYRNVDPNAPITTGAFINATGTVLDFPGLMLPGPRLIYGAVKMDGLTLSTGAPLRPDLVRREERFATNAAGERSAESVAADSNGVVSAWAAASTSVGSQEYITAALAIKGISGDSVPVSTKIGLFSDTFPGTALNFNKWVGVAATVAANKCSLELRAAYDSLIDSVARNWDLTASQYKWRLGVTNLRASMTAIGSVYVDGEFDLKRIDWGVKEGPLFAAVKRNSNTETVIRNNVTYDPAVHVYFRIREASGTVNFEWSTDGLSWTVYTTYPVSSVPFPLTELKVLHWGGDFTEPQAGVQRVSEVN